MKGCVYYTQKYKDCHLCDGMWLYSETFVSVDASGDTF